MVIKAAANDYSLYRKYFNTSCQWRRTGGGAAYLSPESL